MSKSDSGLEVPFKSMSIHREMDAVFVPRFPGVDLSEKQLQFNYDPDSESDRETEKVSNIDTQQQLSRDEIYSIDISGATYSEKFANKNIVADLYFQRWWDELEIQGNYDRHINYEKYISPFESPSSKMIADVSIPRGCLFVAGYPVSMGDEDIIELLWIQFSRWGIVDNIKLTVTTNGIPYGFVYFQDYRSAENFLINSDRVYIRRSLLRVEDARVNRTFYVRHYDGAREHEQNLVNELKRRGDYVSIKYDDKACICDQEGAWLAHFSSWSAAISAFEFLRATGYWHAEWGAQVGQVAQTVAYNLIYVDGLDSRVIDRKMIIIMFQQYGEIRSANLISRGCNSFSFIEFYNPLSSFRAVRCCHEMSWLGQTIRVQHYRRLVPRSASFGHI